MKLFMYTCVARAARGGAWSRVDLSLRVLSVLCVRGLVEFVPIARFSAKANTAHAWTDGPPPATFTV